MADAADDAVTDALISSNNAQTSKVAVDTAVGQIQGLVDTAE